MKFKSRFVLKLLVAAQRNGCTFVSKTTLIVKAEQFNLHLLHSVFPNDAYLALIFDPTSTDPSGSVPQQGWRQLLIDTVCGIWQQL